MNFEELLEQEFKQLSENKDRTVYFALTPKEVKQGYIHYPESNMFTHKGVHTNLQSLKSFVKREFPNNYKDFKYIEIPINQINVDTSVRSEEPDMVSVELPLYYRFNKNQVKELNQ